jgi:hypothetical protein
MVDIPYGILAGKTLLSPPSDPTIIIIQKKDIPVIVCTRCLIFPVNAPVRGMPCFTNTAYCPSFLRTNEMYAPVVHGRGWLKIHPILATIARIQNRICHARYPTMLGICEMNVKQRFVGP